MNQKVISASVIAALTMGLAGCSTPIIPSASVQPNGVVSTSSNPSESSTNTTSSLQDVTLDQVIQQMQDSTPTSIDAALAWQALTGPDGEFAAAASYQAVLDKFGTVEPYATILQAELRHINALTRQLERFGVAVETNPYLGLIEAPSDLKTAAAAWAEGEIKNVALYDQLIVQTTNSKLVMVFNNLRKASQESHLPMFELAAQGDGTLAKSQIIGKGSMGNSRGMNL